MMSLEGSDEKEQGNKQYEKLAMREDNGRGKSCMIDGMGPGLYSNCTDVITGVKI